MTKKKIIILFMLTILVLKLIAQGTSITNPSIPIVTVNQIVYPTFSTNNRFQQNGVTIINQRDRNAAILREVQENEIKREVQRQADIQMLTKSGFPSQSYQEGTSSYYKAFDEINSMLKGELPLNLSRAVFLTENAYYNNTIDYKDYLSTLKSNIDFCNQKIEEEKLDKEDNLVKNMMLFRFMSDTLIITDKKTRRKVTHYPNTYNLEDYDSQINYDSHFVVKLMQSGKGQCHSMPLYYLILAEQMNAEAYLSFSPKHSFVKIQDEKGAWYNVELTCKAILSDAHYMNNSYIKAEAIRNRIYLEPLDKTNTMATMLVDLSRGYFKKYGMDDFYLKCVNTALQYSPNNIDALNLKANYETRLTLTLANLLNAPKPDDMKAKSPEAYKHYEAMQSLYKQVDDLGYEELPDRIYADWLKYIDKEKAKANKLPSIFINTKKE